MCSSDLTNQAGFLRLSRGSELVTALQTQQAVMVFTDTALYSMQYVGAPIVWSAQIIASDISIVSQNAAVFVNNIVYWMGKDKFYYFDGTVHTLNCDLLKHTFSDFNTDQFGQVFAGTLERYNEVWWFYCSAGSTTIDRYVVFNYAETLWYYGTMARTAWIDTSLFNAPMAATYSNNLVLHETGTYDAETGTPLPINAFIQSSEIDLADGHQFMFVWRILPDITFDNSTATNPSVTMSLLPLTNSGSGYNVTSVTSGNHSVAGVSYGPVIRSVALPIEQFTGYLYTRVRGRQMAIRVESTELGVAWQLGSPRFDTRPDGRR